MAKLTLQIITRQWDKSQLSEEAQQVRAQLPNRYQLREQPTFVDTENDIVIDHHGDDLLGNRLQFQRIDNFLLIDRFRFDLQIGKVEFKTTLKAATAPKLLVEMQKGWYQFQYDWRYRVEHEGYVFWLYENVTVNATFESEDSPDIFLETAPEKQFLSLISVNENTN